MPKQSTAANPAIDASQEKTSDKNGFQAVKAITVSTAHAVHDTYGSFISPFLPYLIERLSLLKAEAGLYLLIYQGASVLQPFIGNLGDRKNLRKYALLMPAVTGIALSLLGVAPTLYIGLFLCMLAGISSAIMHSILPPVVGSLSGKQVGKGISFWMVGGQLGVMLGPLVVTAIITTFSINLTPWLMIPGILMSLLLSILLKNMPSHHTTSKDTKVIIPKKELAMILLPITGVVLMRAPMRTSSEVFMPVYLIEGGVNRLLAGSSVSLLFTFGLDGTLIGGPLRDKFGFRKVIIGSILLTSLGMVLFSISFGWMQVIALGILGTSSMAVLPVGLAYVLEHFPKNSSLANGLYLAITFTVNALSGVFTGFLYDKFGGFNTFFSSGIINLLGIPFLFLLPKD